MIVFQNQAPVQNRIVTISATPKNQPKQFFVQKDDYNIKDIWKSKVIQLEAYLQQSQSNLEKEKYKTMKLQEVENRTEYLLHQNAELLSENDVLQQKFNQQRTEMDVWKAKYEGQLNQFMSMKQNYELVIQKKQTENKQYKDKINQISSQNIKEFQNFKENSFQECIFCLKNILEQERIESLKFNHYQSILLYEEQVRKLSDILQNRDQELSEINNKVHSLKSNGDFQLLKSNEEINKLVIKINKEYIETHKQLEIQQQKKEKQYIDQISSIKNLHQNEIQTLENELYKLKNLIQIKNNEISELILQNKQQLFNFDKSQKELNDVINDLQENIKDQYLIKEEEITYLKEKMANLHVADVNDLKQKHEEHENMLYHEIENLKNYKSQKSIELENLIIEKNNLREAFKKENQFLKQENDNFRQDYYRLEQDKKQSIAQYEDDQRKQNSTDEHFQQEMRNQIKYLEDQIDNLKNEILQKTQLIDENVSKHHAIKVKLEEDLRVERQYNHDLKKNLQNLQYDKQKQYEEKEIKINTLNILYLEKAKNFEIQISQKDMVIHKLKENQYHNESDYQYNNELRQQTQIALQTAKMEIDKLNQLIIQMNVKKVVELEEQRKKFEQNNEYHINSYKQSSQNQTNLLIQQQNQLKEILQNKENQIQDLIQKQQKMQDIFSELSNMKDINGSDYELKMRVLRNEMMMTKNLYDAFVQSKNVRYM